MKNHTLWAGAYFVFLITAITALSTLVPISRAGTSDASLRAELRGNDSKPPIFRPTYRNEIHFLLFAKRNKTRVFQEWCSWGYFTRSFTARTVGGRAGTFTIKRNPNRAWTKNFPATHALAKGEFLITSVDLCDGTWIAEPKLPEKDIELSLSGHFEIKADKETREQRVWTGELSSRPLTIVMGAGCAAVLNKTTPAAAE